MKNIRCWFKADKWKILIHIHLIKIQISELSDLYFLYGKNYDN